MKKHDTPDELTGENNIAKFLQTDIRSKQTMDEQNHSKSNTEKQGQSTKIMSLLADRPLFHDQLGRTFIEMRVNGHTENWLIDDPRTIESVSYEYYSIYRSTPSAGALKDAITTLKGRARFEGEFRETWLRTAHLDGKYYLDLCDVDWVVVEISPTDWTLLPTSPTAFYRSAHSSALERPRRKGDLQALWSLINVPEQYRILVLTFLLDCLRPNTNYPILVFEGEQGSAKSTTQQYLKMLIDPSSILLRVPPKKVHDVFIGTANDHLLSFNNLSKLSNELQDALCCFSTGGTHAERALYTNNQESVINVLCPIMLNGIDGLITRQDLLERSIYLQLPRIGEGARKTDTMLNEQFEAQQGQILGALLDLMVAALRALPDISMDGLPRMADFCRLGRAVAVAMGHEQGYFDEAYEQNQRAGLERGLEFCPIYPALLGLLERQQLGFSGNFQELLSRLSGYRDLDTNGWPQSPKALSTMLKRQAPALRKVGIDIYFDDRRRSGGYYVSIKHTDE